mmetsp:Transcript_20257/g.47992  ORF Transcript_20257/g.47992 Transcript_20257/m.47992 type:complete len:231 (+) Transcript_20257:342-1034(+)
MKRDVISLIWSEVTPRSSKSSRKTSCLPTSRCASSRRRSSVEGRCGRDGLGATAGESAALSWETSMEAWARRSSTPAVSPDSWLPSGAKWNSACESVLPTQQVMAVMLSSSSASSLIVVKRSSSRAITSLMHSTQRKCVTRLSRSSDVAPSPPAVLGGAGLALSRGVDGRDDDSSAAAAGIPRCGGEGCLLSPPLGAMPLGEVPSASSDRSCCSHSRSRMIESAVPLLTP